MKESEQLLLDLMVKVFTMESLLLSKGIYTKDEYNAKINEMIHFISANILRSSGVSEDKIKEFIIGFTK